MPPKKEKEGKKNFKPPLPSKDLIPPSIKQPPRDPKPLKQPEIHPLDKKADYKPNNFPPEWPGDDQAKTFDFGLESTLNKFTDTSKFVLPPSFLMNSSQITFWRRPKEFISDRFDYEETMTEKKLTRRGSLAKSALDLKGKSSAFKRTPITVEGNAYSSPEIAEDDIHVNSPKKRDVVVQIKVFEIIDREETEEEFEKRKKELEEKKAKDTKKKPPSKATDIPLEDVLSTVKDIKLSNIDMSNHYPALSKWIGSQLQMIKDRGLLDAFSGKPLHSKIFPQNDGLPVLCKSGRYWVKLYFMGKERKIEIDDKMPISVTNLCMFPRSVNKEEIWPMLFTKALLKLGFFSSENPLEYGDASVLYALTGYLPETLAIPKIMLPEDWKFIAEVLKDYHYVNGTAVVSCFCSPQYKPYAVSNKVATEKEAFVSELLEKSQCINSEEKEAREEEKDSHGAGGIFSRKMSPNKIKTTLNILYKEPPNVGEQPSNMNSQREKPNYVIPGVSYPIFEVFFNENFNMAYVQKRNEQEIKWRQELQELSKVNIHKMLKEEKLEFRKRKKEIREKIHDEIKKRTELVKDAPIQYRFFRIKSSLAKVPLINIMNQFSTEEIYLAKKTTLNKLSRPPNSNFDLPEIKLDDKSVYSQQVSTSQMDSSVLNKALDDFSSLPNVLEPMKRGTGGVWVMEKDLATCFEFIQIFFNPSKFTYHKHVSFQPNPDFELTRNDACEIIVIEENLEMNIDPNAMLINKIPFILTFAAQKALGELITPDPNCIVQKFDFQNFEAIKNYKTLSEYMDSLHLLIENKNQVFRVMVNSPLGFSLWVSCYNNFKMMSMSDYLTKYENFSTKSMVCEYPAVEKERYHVFFKYKISCTENDAKVIIKIKNASEHYILRYLRYKLFDVQACKKSAPYLSEGIIQNKNEQIFEVLESNIITLNKEVNYILILESKPTVGLAEGNIEFEFLSKSQINIEQLEMVEPQEYTDKYNANKYGILFRERLFVNDDVYASFFVRLVNINRDNSSVAQQKDPKKKGNELSEGTEIELTEKRLITLELFEDEKLLIVSQGLNFVIISHHLLTPNKDESKNYYLQARFDLREWPTSAHLSDDTRNLTWFLRNFSNESIAIVKDTQKEDLEKSIKKSWEDKEPGRAERAKKSRQKYLLWAKKEEGSVLTEQELELLNEPRISRKQREEELKTAGQKNKIPPKNDKKPVGKQTAKKEEAVDEKKEKIWPASQLHLMKEIQNFLEHMEEPRILEEKPLHGGLVDVRSIENKEELREGYWMGREDYLVQMKRNAENRENFKSYQVENKRKLLEDFELAKKMYVEKLAELLKERDELKKGNSVQREKERILVDFCSQERPNPEEFEKILNEANQNSDFDPNLLKIGRRSLMNAKLLNVVEKLNNAVTGFELQIIQSCLAEITKENYMVDEDIIDKANEIVEEAKNNPNYISERQAELKKTAKKPPGKK